MQIHSLQHNVSKVHCESVFEPGASGLPYYWTLPVCVPDVLGALAVWQQIYIYIYIYILRQKISLVSVSSSAPRVLQKVMRSADKKEGFVYAQPAGLTCRFNL